MNLTKCRYYAQNNNNKNKDMDIKQKYREENNKEPYCQTQTGNYVKSGSYSDEYVKWLEKQLTIPAAAG
jgi:hypothetical protein